MTTSMPRLTFGVLAVVLVGSLLASAPVEAQTADGQTAGGQVAERDSLIAAQENLLNTYRCMFGVDTAAVSGGCPDPDRIQPGAAPQNPSQQDIDARDSLIAAQENLLNTYRCQHNIDTQLVAGGCPRTGVSQTAPNTATEPGQSQISNADIPTQARHLSVQLGDLTDNAADMVLRTFFDLYGCLKGTVCSWTIEAHRYIAIIENVIDVYGRSYPRDSWFSILDQLEDALRTLDTVVNTFSDIADGYIAPDATGFAELKSRGVGVLNSLSGDIFNQVEDAVDQAEVLEVPEDALRSVRQAVDNARSRISEVLPLLDG